MLNENEKNSNLSISTNISISPEENRTSNKENRQKTRPFNFLLTNARSLAPKIGSLLDYFEELDLSMAIVAESWLKPGEKLEEDIIDLEFGESISVLHKSRPTRRGKNAGGGIAVLYNNNKMSLKPVNIGAGKAEIIAAAGSITGIRRKVVVIGMYVRPQTKAEETHRIFEVVENAIQKFKTDLSDPIVIIAGDINRRNIDEAIGIFPDINKYEPLSSRGRYDLDIVATNINQSITACESRSPLETCLLYTSPSPRD